MLRGARYRARKAGIPFNLTLEDIIIPDECPVLGIPIRHRDGGKHGDDNSPQLDRIVPSFGYVKGNVMVISGRANRIKSDATYEELEVLTAFYRNYFNAIREAKAH